jgi:antitoxin component of MazEF toxin-antitoxin module
MKKHSSSYTSYEVITQKEDEDLLIPIPPMLLKALDWKEGDEIDINLDDKGNYVLRKSTK